jgi:hypothetical protein
MSSAFAVAFWFWKNKTVSRIAGIRMGIVTVSLFLLALFTRSATAWILVSLAICLIMFYKVYGTVAPFRLLILAIPIYMVLRLNNVLTREVVEGLLARVLDNERISSLSVRLLQEELFGLRALERPLFGWGHMARAWPVDPYSGLPMIAMVDSLFMILLGTRGILGLIAFYTAMLIGPWCIFGSVSHSREKGRNEIKSTINNAVILSIMVVLVMVDSLMNGFMNPTYLLCGGALVSVYLTYRRSIRLVDGIY